MALPINRTNKMLICIVLGCSLFGCSAVGGYLKDRVYDLTDVVDLKYSTGIGIGVKVESSNYISIGLAYGVYNMNEYYGRRLTQKWQTVVHYMIAGTDGELKLNECEQTLIPS